MKHKDRVRVPFGHNSDMDHLAMVIYREFQRGGQWAELEDSEPWKLYGKEKGDFVVEAFRRAAEAVIAEWCSPAVW